MYCILDHFWWHRQAAHEPVMAEDMCKTAVRVGALAQRSMRTFRREALPPSDDEWEVEDRLEVLQKAVGTSTTSTTSSTRTNTNTDQHRQYCSYYYYYYYYCQATTLLSVIAFAVFGQTVMEITRASRHRGYVPEMKHGETYAGTVSPCRVVISNTCTDQCIAWQHGINDRPSVTKHAQTGTTHEDWALLVHSSFGCACNPLSATAHPHAQLSLLTYIAQGRGDIMDWFNERCECFSIWLQMHEEESMQAGVCAACTFTLTDAVFNLLYNLTECAAEYDRHCQCTDQYSHSVLISTVSVLISTINVLISTVSVLISTGSVLLSTVSVLISTVSVLISTVSVLISTVSVLISTGSALISTGCVLISTGSVLISTGSVLISTSSVLISTGSVLISTVSVLISTVSVLISAVSVLISTVSALISTVSVLISTPHHNTPHHNTPAPL